MLFSKYPNVMQHDASDCAAAAVATVLITYKQEISIMKIREVIGTDLYGTSVKGIIEGLEKLKYSAKAVRCELKDINDEVTLPAIAQITTKEGLNHFVVIHKIKKNKRIIIANPERGLEDIDLEDFEKQFQGVVIFLAPSSEFEKVIYKDKGMINLFKSLILPQKKLLITIILASFLLSVIGILSSTFLKVLMDEVIPYQLKNSLYVLLLVYAIVVLFQTLLSAFRQQIILFLSRKVDIPILLGYYNHIIHLPYSFFASRKVGDVITRFQDAMTIKGIFTNASVSLILDVLLSTVTAIILWNMNSSLFGILIIMVLINVILIYIFKKPYKKLNYEQMEAGSALNSHLIESLQNIETVKSQNDEAQQIDRLETKFVRALKVGYREGTVKNMQDVASNFIGLFGNLLFMGVGALYIIDGKLTIGDLLVFQTLSQYFTEPISNLVTLQLTFQEASIAMSRLSELMSLNREDIENNKLNNINLKGDIVFKNLEFSYGSRPAVISEFNLTIKNGERIAIIGESGAGKSTLARLLLKFVTPKNGEIMMGKHDLNDIDRKQLRKKIAYIPQNIQLFTGTIIDNLKVGNEEATYEEIINVCKISGASAFIDELPNRYGSIIEEGGSNLSGGEKQRIAIARALLSDSDIYIFDEATSNLDSFSERKLHDLIFSELNKKTSIIIAHRLSTIVRCDLICLMEGGKIIEQGSHQQLMEVNGEYATMIQHQMIDDIKVNSDKKIVTEEIEYA